MYHFFSLAKCQIKNEKHHSEEKLEKNPLKKFSYSFEKLTITVNNQFKCTCGFTFTNVIWAEQKMLHFYISQNKTKITKTNVIAKRVWFIKNRLKHYYKNNNIHCKEDQIKYFIFLTLSTWMDANKSFSNIYFRAENEFTQ